MEQGEFLRRGILLHDENTFVRAWVTGAFIAIALLMTIEGFTLYKATVDYMKAGEVPSKKLVTDVFPLEKTKDAFETALNSPDVIKVMVEP